MKSELRQISAEDITKAVKRMCIESNTSLGNDMLEALRQAQKLEESPVGRNIFDQILRNAESRSGGPTAVSGRACSVF